MSSGKYGADDYLREFGEQKLAGLINKPIVELAGIDYLLNMSVEVDDFFEQSVCESDEQFKRFEKRIANQYKLKPNQIRKKIQIARSLFELLCEGEDEIFYDETREGNNTFITRGCTKVSKIYTLLILKKALLVIDPSWLEYKNLSSAKDLRGFLRKSLEVKAWTRKNEVGSILFQKDFLDQIHYSPKEYFKHVKEIKSVVNLPYIFGPGDVLIPGVHDGICHLSKTYSALYEIDKGTNPLFKVLNYLPFKSESDRHDFLGCLVGLFFIPYHLGSHPMIIIKGDGAGIGKSTLAEIIDKLMNSSPRGSIGFSKNEEELEKQIATKILASNVVVIDNVRSIKPVSSPLLEKCATDALLTFRELGTQNTIARPNDCVFVLTLNGGSFSEDILDRSIVIELLHKEKKAEAFPYSGQISDYVSDHKDEIIQTLAKLIRDGVSHNSYSSRFNGLHRFNDWANKVKNVMAIYEYSFLENAKEKKMSNDPLLIALVRLIHEEAPPRNIYEVPMPNTPTMRHAFFSVSKTSGEILEEIKFRKYEFQDDLSSVMLGKRLQQLASKEPSIVEFDDEKFKVEVKCSKSTKGGNNKCYSVKSSLIT